MPPLLRLHARLARPLGVIVRVEQPSIRGFALTFDDGPGPHTAAALDVLATHRAPATFFVLGAHVVRHPELLARIDREGHEIGNHTHDHRALPGLGWRRTATQLSRCDEAIRSVLGKPPAFTRPPFGWSSLPYGLQNRLARRLAFGWSRSAEDWKPQVPEEIARRILQNLRAGDIVLLHDGSDRPDEPAHADRSSTIAALPLIIEGARRTGLEPVSLSRLLASGRARHAYWTKHST